MPPFGNIYGMDVFVTNDLAEDEEIAFNAGSHIELVKMAYKDIDTHGQQTVSQFLFISHPSPGWVPASRGRGVFVHCDTAPKPVELYFIVRGTGASKKCNKAHYRAWLVRKVLSHSCRSLPYDSHRMHQYLQNRICSAI